MAGTNESITFTYKQGDKNVKITKAKCDCISLILRFGLFVLMNFLQEHQ